VKWIFLIAQPIAAYTASLIALLVMDIKFMLPKFGMAHIRPLGGRSQILRDMLWSRFPTVIAVITDCTEWEITKLSIAL